METAPQVESGKQAGRPNNLSRGRYDDWSLDDILRHLRSVSDEIGGIPRINTLWHRINELGKDEPSPRFINSRIPFRNALELIGYPNIYSWERSDYINWGVKFLYANNDLLPSQNSIDYLSKLKRGPSKSQIKIIFGKLNLYKAEVWSAYHEDKVAKKDYKEGRLSEIEAGLNSGTLSPELFNNAASEDEMINLLAKYEVAKELLPHAQDELLIADSKSNKGRSFTARLRKRNDGLSAGDIETTALYLGVYDDIWPRDKSYMESLKIPDYFAEHNRLKMVNLVLKDLPLPAA